MLYQRRNLQQMCWIICIEQCVSDLFLFRITVIRTLSISISNSTLSPSFLHARQSCTFHKHSETAQERSSFAPEQQGRAVEHSCGACRHHTPLRMMHTFRAAPTENPRFTFCEDGLSPIPTWFTVGFLPSCRIVRRPFSKSASSFMPYIQCWQSQRWMQERGRHGTVHQALCAMPVLFY